MKKAHLLRCTGSRSLQRTARVCSASRLCARLASGPFDPARRKEAFILNAQELIRFLDRMGAFPLTSARSRAVKFS